MSTQRPNRLNVRSSGLRVVVIPTFTLLIVAMVVAQALSVQKPIGDGTAMSIRSLTAVDTQTYKGPSTVSKAPTMVRPVSEALAPSRKPPMEGGPTSDIGPIQPATQNHVHTRPSIDGREMPELIPDAVSFSLFVRMTLGSDNTDKSQQRQRAYIRHVLRVAAQAEGDTQAPAEPEIDAVLSYVRTYEAAVRQLEKEASAAVAANDVAGKSDIDRRQSALMQNIGDGLTKHLASDTATKIQRYVQHVFKRNIKIAY